MTNKNITKDNKNVDKKRAANDPELCVAVFDLEKLLTITQDGASNFYYKRKFAVYNFTVYNIVNKVGYCYMWDKTEAKRSSNKIETYLLTFLKIMKEKGFKEFCFYFDNGGGQNHNGFIYAIWEYAAFTLKIKISHKFLEVILKMREIVCTHVLNVKKREINLCSCTMDYSSKMCKSYRQTLCSI